MKDDNQKDTFGAKHMMKSYKLNKIRFPCFASATYCSMRLKFRGKSCGPDIVEKHRELS